MSDDLIPPARPAGGPVPPAERVFKVPPPQGISGQESKKPSGDMIKNQTAPLGKAGQGFSPGNLWQLLTKGFSLRGRQASFGRKTSGGAGPRSLFASPIRLQGIDSVKQLLASGIDLDSVNKVLTGALVLLMVYSITVAVNRKSSITKLMQSISHVRFAKSASRAIEAYQPVDYYLGQVRGRDIFNPVGEVKVQAMPEALPPPEPPKPKLKEMANGFSVVGIAWGETPKTMIQDSATQEIYFLEKDDLIGKTEIKVKDIFRSKIVISYGEEEMEL